MLSRADDAAALVETFRNSDPGDRTVASTSRVKQVLEPTLLLRQLREEVKAGTLAATRAEEGKESADTFEGRVVRILGSLGWDKKLRHVLFNILEEANRNREYTLESKPRAEVGAMRSTADPVGCVEAARRQWENSINEELLAISRERGQPLLRRRQSPADQDGSAEGSRRDGEDGVKLRFLYDAEDLLETMIQITASDHPATNERVDILDSPLWGLVQVPLGTPEFRVLRKRYSDLNPRNWQLGIDDMPFLHDPDAPGAAATRQAVDKFVEGKRRLGAKVVGEGFPPAARQFARTGVPGDLRPVFWRTCLGLGMGGKVTEEERREYECLSQHVEQVELLTDSLFTMDVDHLTDSDHYFPFEDALRNVLLAFSRDHTVLQRAHCLTHLPIFGHGGNHGIPGDAAVPLSGVQPFKGLSCYAAPLTFLYDNEAALFSVFRAMYCRYWCKLNVIRSQEDCLMGLCQVFEQLVQIHDPQLFFHLIQIGAHPLRIAMPWIQHAFVDLLEPAQVLNLWDRIIGFDDLTLLPVLAAAIFVYRSPVAMTATSSAHALELFQDGTELRVAPLLQNFIFPVPF